MGVSETNLCSWYHINKLNKFLDIVEAEVDYKHWYFGHYHDDVLIDNNHTLVYEKIIKFKENDKT